MISWFQIFLSNSTCAAKAWVEGYALAASTAATAEELFRRKGFGGLVFFKKWAKLIEGTGRREGREEARAAAVRAEKQRRLTLMTTALTVWLDSTTVGLYKLNAVDS